MPSLPCLLLLLPPALLLLPTLTQAQAKAQPFPQWFTEDLLLTPQHTPNHTLAEFSFQLFQPDTFGQQHGTVFPLRVGEVLPFLSGVGVQAVGFSLTAGHLSLASSMGPSLQSSMNSAGKKSSVGPTAPPSGAQVSLVPFEAWQAARPALGLLGGMFCASLGGGRLELLSIPAAFFSVPSAQQAAISLSAQNVCTENLNAVTDLLPCRSHAGLASMLNSKHFFSQPWHSISVHLTRVGAEGWLLRFQVQALLKAGSETRKLSDLVSGGRAMRGVCPVARDSTVRWKISPPSPGMLRPVSGRRLPHTDELFWTTKDGFDIDLVADPAIPHGQRQQQQERGSAGKRKQLVRRSVAGFSQRDGKINTLIASPGMVEYFQIFPFGINPLVNRMTVLGGKVLNSTFTPSRQRGLPSALYLMINATDSTRISVPFEKVLLKYTEHPPDAERGLDIPPSILLVDGQRIYTPPLLVDMPVPDFSMPYNVIIMTSTLVALIFGNLFNLITRRWKVVKSE